MSVDVVETEPQFLPSQRGQGLGRPRPFQASLSGLEGDSICFAGDCHDGEAAVKQMITVFNSLKAKADDRFASIFEPQVKSIKAEFDDVGFFSKFFILGGGCCRLKGIGARAVVVTKAMFAHLNLGQPVSTPPISNTSAIENLFSMLLPFVIIGGGIYLFGPAIRSWINKKSGAVNGLGTSRKRRQRQLPARRSFRGRR